MKTVLFLALLLFSQIGFAQESICHKYNEINPTQEPSNGPSCRVVGDTFYLEGMITEDIYYELRDSYPSVKHLELNSYGGLIEGAYKIATIVRERQITTNVRKNAKCASACTVIFQAGVRRSAHPSVKFLYHAVRLSNLWVANWLDLRYEYGREYSRETLAQQFAEVQSESEKLFNVLVEYGVKPEFIEYYKSLPDSPSWFPDGNFTRTSNLIISSPELIKYNIVQEFDYRDEFPETI